MTSDEFWKDDPQLFVSYRTSFINKKKRELEEIDYISWLQGLYINDGNKKISIELRQFLANLVSSLFKSKKDNTQIDTYPKKPYGQLAKEKQKKKKEEQTKYKDYYNSLIYFGSIKQRYLEKMKKRGE